MKTALRLEGEITEDGQLIVDLPPEFPRGRVVVTLEPLPAALASGEERLDAIYTLLETRCETGEVDVAARHDEHQDDLELTEEDLKGAGLTAEEIASSPEIGAWASDLKLQQAVEEAERDIAEGNWVEGSEVVGKLKRWSAGGP